MTSPAAGIVLKVPAPLHSQITIFEFMYACINSTELTYSRLAMSKLALNLSEMTHAFRVLTADCVEGRLHQRNAFAHSLVARHSKASMRKLRL